VLGDHLGFTAWKGRSPVALDSERRARRRAEILESVAGAIAVAMTRRSEMGKSMVNMVSPAMRTSAS